MINNGHDALGQQYRSHPSDAVVIAEPLWSGMHHSSFAVSDFFNIRLRPRVLCHDSNMAHQRTEVD